MREIKFRLIRDGKIVGYEKWYPGQKRHDTENPSWLWMAKPSWLYSKDGEFWKPNAILHDSKDQFTNLTDGNVKEIYERDIVRGAGERQGGPSEVFYGYGQWQPFSFVGSYNGKDFEVIGNTHENPDLLEAKK